MAGTYDPVAAVDEAAGVLHAGSYCCVGRATNAATATWLTADGFGVEARRRSTLARPTLEVHFASNCAREGNGLRYFDSLDPIDALLLLSAAT